MPLVLWPFSVFKRRRAREAALARRKLVLLTHQDEYLDAGAVRSRSGTPQEAEQYVVTLDRPTLPALILYSGPRGATARAIYENVVPKAGEELTFWDRATARGVKRGEQ